MSNSAMRKEFETWCANTLGGPISVNGRGEYEDQEMEYCWWAWQASREALVIALPDEKSIIDEFDDYGDGWNSGINRSERAIEAAGVRVKRCPSD